MAADARLDQRVLVLAPSGRDADVLSELLAGSGFASDVCADGKELANQLRAGAGIALIAEEALDVPDLVRLRDTLAAQPAWSEIPIVLLAAPRHDAAALVDRLAEDGHGHVTVLERPVRPSTLVAMVRAALHARMRQYQVRDELARRTEAEAALREADRRKDELLAMLAHELRNPLAALRNAAVTAHLDEARRPRALVIVQRQADRLVRLVDDLLDVARITHGKVALRQDDIFIAHLVERALETVRPFIDECGHRLSVSLRDEMLAVHGDPERLEQVLVNLLMNAAKYTEPGGTITVQAERDGDDAVLHVRDTGIGLSADMLPRVFDLFAQSERTLDRAQGGLGIGLTLVRRLVELHNGTCNAHSEGLGKGTEFVVRLAALPPRQLSEGASASLPSPRVHARVLVVEDNADVADALVMLLETLGHQVEVVHDGPSALTAVQRSAPHVALIDIGLPGMDGYDLARRMRMLPEGRTMALVALTGYGREEDKERATAAGFDHHFTKPVQTDALEGLVARLGRQDKERGTVH